MNQYQLNELIQVIETIIDILNENNCEQQLLIAYKLRESIDTISFEKTKDE